MQPLHYVLPSACIPVAIREPGLVLGACVVVFLLLLVCVRCICSQTQAPHILSATLL